MAQAAEDLLVRIDATTEQLRRELKRADDTVGKSARHIDKRLEKVDKAFNRLNRAASSATAVLGGLGVAFGLSEVAQFAKDQARAAEEVVRMSQALGISTDSVQELNYAFGRFGAAPDDVSDALNTLADRAQDAVAGTKSMVEDFALLGISVDQLRGKRPDELFDLFAEAVQNTSNIQERNAAVVRTLGDDLGRKLLPMLVETKGGYQDLRKEAQDLGVVMDSEVLNNAVHIREEFDKASKILGTSFMNALNEATPILVKMAEEMAQIATYWGDTFGSTGDTRRRLEGLTQQRDLMLERLVSGKTAMGRDISDTKKTFLRERIEELNAEILEITQDFGAVRSPTAGVRTATAGRSSGARRILGAAPNPLTKKSMLEQQRLRYLELDLIGKIKTQEEVREEIRQRALNAARGVNETLIQQNLNLEEQLALMGAIEAPGRTVDEAVANMEARFTELDSFAKEAAENMQDYFGNTFFGFMQGEFDNLEQGFKQMIDRMAAEALAAQLARKMFGGMVEGGEGKGWVGAVGSFVGSLFGGGKAAGGNVAAGRMYEVNERGPELLSVGNRDYLMMGGRGGQVTPNNQLGGGGTVINMNVYANDAGSFKQSKSQILTDLKRGLS